MFGDGGIVPGGPLSAYYQCAHCIAQEDFVRLKYQVLSPLSCRFSSKNKRVSMATWSNQCLYQFWEKFYPKGCGDKELNAGMIGDMNWFSLAVWFMGDGTRDRKQLRFSVGKQIDLLPIVDAMNLKFGSMFEAKFYTREWFLKIRDNKAFINGVKPYLLPIFSYKIV
jgi:hypothetical protein